MLDTNKCVCENNALMFIDGRKIADDIISDLKIFFADKKASLAILWLGGDKATESFINIKLKTA